MILKNRLSGHRTEIPHNSPMRASVLDTHPLTFATETNTLARMIILPHSPLLNYFTCSVKGKDIKRRVTVGLDADDLRLATTPRVA